MLRSEELFVRRGGDGGGQCRVGARPGRTGGEHLVLDLGARGDRHRVQDVGVGGDARADFASEIADVAKKFPHINVLRLGSDARMNSPGSESGNWRWQLEAGALTDATATMLRAAAVGEGR